MGFSLARAAAMRGASVTLVTGPVHLETPRHVKRLNVETADQMHQAVAKEAASADVIIMAAAVADFTPARPKGTKIKKNGHQPEPLELKTTVDILKTVAGTKGTKTVVGFALETDDEMEHARAKLKSKNADMIVLNSLRDPGAGFGGETNKVTLMLRTGETEELPRQSKFDVAHAILDRVRTIRQH
jgi:phosphopantothenoylcysteine decarboxylase/phosphopantothenate--cysteine ligase